ncbi:putative PE-PGRS family protein PE PGRS3 [Luteimicrobium xylanilyticum]|uniref:Putative PE-PGRS family protein PE PGRS3 n=1 Tax=Luteimicrobium xylanilyticum TaxID=1133546 RepID=A0A5P9Q723_9MICO|nr:sigma-70 family RNA polymerase sigma factor [Luteimicrobium xylanilyticum]QFU96900.1 putative PE-PGRS family protein PE PGRS3 [Luteimicrobium xylanilyticum]
MTALDPGTPGTASDAELIAAVRAGDKHAYGELWERHSAAAAAVARQYVPRPADADDVVSDAFAKVLSVLQSGGGPDVAFRAYLFTVVRHTAYGLTEGSRRQRPTDDWAMYESAFGLAASTEEPALEGFERSVVARAYRELPERWQAVLWYTEIESLTPAQIAPLLGLTANGVSALAYRAREGLRQSYLQQHLNGSADEGCRGVNGLLGSYVRGGLAKRETAQVETHLSGCGDCRALVLELGDVAHGMRGVVAPLVLGTGALALVGHALPLGGAVGGAGVAGGAATGTGSATGTGVAAGAGTTGAGGAGASGAAVGSGGAAASSGVGTGVGAAASGASASGSAAAAGAGGTATAGATGLGAFFAAAPITATVVTVGLTAAVGLGVAAGLGAFSHRGSPEAAPVPSVEVPLASATVPATTVPVVGPDTPDLTSPTTVAPTQPADVPTTEVTAPVVPPVTLPTATPTTPPPVPTPANLTLGLDSAPTFTVGSATQVALTASNSGGTSAHDVDVTLQLPQSVEASGASLAPSGTGGSGGGLAGGVVRLDVPEGTCSVSPPSSPTSGSAVTCHLSSLDPGAKAGVVLTLTPRSRSFGGFAWAISAEGYAAPWTGTWTPEDTTVHSANLVPSSASDVTVANPGEGDVTFGLQNTGDAGVPSSATVALAVPDGVEVTSLSGGGSWTAVDGTGGTVWQVPAGFTLGSGGSTTLTAHVVADGPGGATGTAPAGTGRATLAVRGAIADNTTPSVSEGLTVEQPWQGAAAGTPALQCVGPDSVGNATVTVPVASTSAAATTATVTRDAVQGDAGRSGAATGSGSIDVPVTYAPEASTGLTVTFQRTVAGTVRTFTVLTSYTADSCAPRLAVADADAPSASPVALANPDTTTVTAAVTNTGSVAASGLTATVQVVGGETYTVGGDWTQVGETTNGASTWTYSGTVAAKNGRVALPVALTTTDGTAAGTGSLSVTFAPANPDPTVSDPTVTWTQGLTVEGPWTETTLSADAAMQCTGWEQPGQGTITIDVHNGSAVAAFKAGADGADSVTVGPGDSEPLVVPVTYQRHGWHHARSGSVDVTLTRDGRTTTRTVSYVQQPCPGKPVLDAHDGAGASATNPGHVTVSASVTNDGTARARDVVATLDLPTGYTVDDVGGDFHGRGRSIVADRSLAVGDTATLTLDLTVDVDRTAGATDIVGVTFDARRADPSDPATIQVATEARWPVDATAAAQCDGTVTATLTNGSASDVSATVDGTTVTVPGNGTQQLTVRADRRHHVVQAGSVHVTFRHDGFTTTRDAAYDAPDCTHPAASVASVGDCTFDQGTQQSSAPVAILLDNSKSAVAVWFRVSGGDGVLVQAGDTATVQRSVGEQDAVFTVRAAGQTFTLPVDGVQCVPEFHPWRWYDRGDRVTDGSDVYVSTRHQFAVADPHTWVGHFTWQAED